MTRAGDTVGGQQTMDAEQTGALGRPAQRFDRGAARRSKQLVLIGVVGLILFSVLNVYLANRRPTLPEELDGVVVLENLSAEVIDGSIAYPRRPPAGGPRAEHAQLCGLYRVPIADENAVASLATGAVWIAYRPDLSNDDIEALREAAEGELDALIAPYPGLDAPVVLTAWGRQLRVSDPTDERIAMFIQIYKNDERAPDADDSCAEGVGLPQP